MAYNIISCSTLKKVDFNYKFKKYCEKEIKDHCSKSDSKLEALHCLSELVLNDTLLDKPQRVHSTCRKQLRYEFLQLNENIDLDADLKRVCLTDINSLCADVKAGKGQLLECLRSKKSQLASQCKKKLFQRDEFNLIEQGSDFTLKRECKNSIKLYCNEVTDDESNSEEVNKEDILGCLRKRLGQPDLEPSCRSIVIERLISQSEDFRLNPILWKSCHTDVQSKCDAEFKLSKDPTRSLHGKAMKCLKLLFVKDRLSSKQCALLVEESMRESALIDYRLDPLLVESCIKELESLCADDSNDKKENCLRLKFQQKIIDKYSNARCFEEVRRIIIEGRADVFVDRELSQICSTDLARYCSNIAPGSSQQLRCLLGIKQSKDTKLTEACEEKLSSRKELWQLANVDDGLEGVNDLARLINESEHRGYLFFILFSIVMVIFVLGCLCRPAVFKARIDKRK